MIRRTWVASVHGINVEAPSGAERITGGSGALTRSSRRRPPRSLSVTSAPRLTPGVALPRAIGEQRLCSERGRGTINRCAWLRMVRCRRGLILNVAAGLAGITKSYLSLLERGQRGFNRWGLLEDLAGTLGCSVPT